MKKFLKNYKSTIILLAAIIVGAIVGIVFKEKAAVLSPLGDLFLNLMFIIIVPLVFLNISTAIAKMTQPKRFGKMMIGIISVFIITSIVALIVGFIATLPIKLVSTEDGDQIKSSLEEMSNGNVDQNENNENILQSTVNLLTVNDFSGLLSRNNIIAIIVFAVIFGIAAQMSGKKAKPVVDFLDSANEIVMNIVKIIMYYAPIGLGCYFASLVGTFGKEIAIGYVKTFVIYIIVALLFYFVVYTLYAFLSAGKKGVIAFWKNIIPSTITSLATCSSAASIPVNIQASKNIGVSDDIAETLVPLGTSFHKDGSIIGSVFKIMFLVCLFGTNVSGIGSILQILGVAFIATLLVTAVPIGGGTISEMMIITMMGYPISALPILTIIATIIDPPATMLNVVGDSSCSMLVARFIDGKGWIDKKSKNEK